MECFLYFLNYNKNINNNSSNNINNYKIWQPWRDLTLNNTTVALPTSEASLSHHVSTAVASTASRINIFNCYYYYNRYSEKKRRGNLAHTITLTIYTITICLSKIKIEKKIRVKLIFMFCAQRKRPKISKNKKLLNE